MRLGSAMDFDCGVALLTCLTGIPPLACEPRLLIAIRAAGPDLAELAIKPALNATARFAIVTLAGRSEAPALPIVRRLMQELLRDA